MGTGCGGRRYDSAWLLCPRRAGVSVSYWAAMGIGHGFPSSLERERVSTRIGLQRCHSRHRAAASLFSSIGCRVGGITSYVDRSDAPAIVSSRYPRNTKYMCCHWLAGLGSDSATSSGSLCQWAINRQSSNQAIPFSSPGQHHLPSSWRLASICPRTSWPSARSSLTTVCVEMRH